MARQPNYKSTTSMLDLFLLIAVGFVTLFVLAFILIKPVNPTQQDVEAREDLIVSLKWNDSLNTDIDMWMLDPTGEVVSFKKKSVNGATLERDDRGWNNEVVYINGEEKNVNTNLEVIRVKKLFDGEYFFSVQYYSKKMCRLCADIEPFTFNIYDSKKHQQLVIHEGNVVVQGETGVVRLSVKNGSIVNVAQSSRQIAYEFHNVNGLPDGDNGYPYGGTP